MDQNLTKEQIEDIKTRVDAFQIEFKELASKHGVDIVGFPQYQQDPKTGAFHTLMRMQIIDTKYRPIPSPIQDEKGGIIKE